MARCHNAGFLDHQISKWEINAIRRASTLLFCYLDAGADLEVFIYRIPAHQRDALRTVHIAGRGKSNTLPQERKLEGKHHAPAVTQGENQCRLACYGRDYCGRRRG